MVQQLNWEDRRILKLEQPDNYYDVLLELDRENQPNPKLRERVVNYRTIDAKWAAAHPTPEQP